MKATADTAHFRSIHTWSITKKKNDARAQLIVQLKC